MPTFETAEMESDFRQPVQTEPWLFCDAERIWSVPDHTLQVYEVKHRTTSPQSHHPRTNVRRED